jgi:hypothetical protein
MKNIVNILSLKTRILKSSIFIVLILLSCNEKNFLNEEPLDFYSPENSYVTFKNFDAAVNNLYSTFRDEFYRSSTTWSKSPRIMLQATDLVYYNFDAGDNATYPLLLVPTSDFVYNAVWQPAYKIIYDANVIIGRADGEQSQLTEDDKIKIKAEAAFFRAYMYKMLADLYGGVPLVLEETTKPKRDYTRADRNEIYEHCVTDLVFASENLNDIIEVDDSRISKLAAYHVLAEVYISLGQYTDAIKAASVVIDDPRTALMTKRFGSRLNDQYNPNMPWASGGDVYWDLFRKDNQNRSSGNTESIWILPYDYNIAGGGDGGILWEVNINPRLWSVILKNTSNGKSVNMIPSPNTYYGGRPGGKMRLTEYFYHQLWEKSGYDQDIRNASYNIIRDLKVNNPASDYHGKWVLADKVPIALKSFNDTVRNFFPVIAKISSMGDHPKDVWIENQTVPGSISSTTGPSNTTYRDEYKIRLAETYLLRAEAYLGNNDKINAAKDINVVRQRAHAPEINASDVDIDYILDERMRELYIEEFRLLTLSRLGKLVERTKKYNPVVGNNYKEYQNLWPIPYSEIEKNTGAVLEQNPGY